MKEKIQKLKGKEKMEENIYSFVENNFTLKEFFKYSYEELETIRLYINLELFDINRRNRNILENDEIGEPDTVQLIKMYSNEGYNCLDYMLSYRLKVDMATVSLEEELQNITNNNINKYTNQGNDIQEKLITLLNEVDEYNAVNMKKIKYIDVIDYLLNRKVPEFKSTPDSNFFKSVDIIDLLYVHIILESDLINITKINNKTVEADYLDITNKKNNEYYIDILSNYYKSKKNGKHIKLDLKDTDSIFKEKDRGTRIYKIATYYKYLIEKEKIDIILKLREILDAETERNGMKIRSHYFKYKYFKKVEDLPYSKNTKEKIYSILNYILNYRYKDETPYIPVNMLIYSNDKESVEKITQIVGEFMWFFGYLPDNMRYYGEYVNNIILDKFSIKELYYEEEKKKTGILLLHNFDNLVYIDAMQQSLILNILTDEIEKNNNEVCTIIYGDRTLLKQILGNHPKLSQMLINLELEIDDLDINKVCDLLVEKLEKIVDVSDEIKEKLYNYIKDTYRQSDVQNMEYINKLYNTVVFNMNKNFSTRNKQELKIQNIPEAYNTRDLTTILKDINELIGLKGIKEQIYDLIALLKFNKKANIDIKWFNLHMVFQGNPGTGKTTVARLITDIFFNLGYINQNKLVEVTAKDLISEYIGQTSGKTFNVVKSALGGVLFIDEAYSITMSNGTTGANFGEECVAMLLKLMEDYKDKLIVIFAGYKDEMSKFLDTNPGLTSRVGYKIQFEDFTVEELTQIFVNLLQKNKLEITDDALKEVRRIIQISSGIKDFGNARYINKMFQKILIEHSKNIEYNSKKKSLYVINKEDIKEESLVVDSNIRKIGFM